MICFLLLFLFLFFLLLLVVVVVVFVVDVDSKFGSPEKNVCKTFSATASTGSSRCASNLDQPQLSPTVCPLSKVKVWFDLGKIPSFGW